MPVSVRSYRGLGDRREAIWSNCWARRHGAFHFRSAKLMETPSQERLRSFVRAAQPDAGPDQPEGNGQPDSELFEVQLGRALESDEIASQLNEVGIAREYLTKCAQDATSELWGKVPEEERRVQDTRAALKNAESALSSARAELNALPPPKS